MKGREWSLWIGIELCSTKPDGVIRGTSQHEKVGHPKQDRYPGGLEERANPLDPLLKALDNRAESIALATYRRKFAHSELNRTQRNAPAVSIIMKITLSSVFSVLFWGFFAWMENVCRGWTSAFGSLQMWNPNVSVWFLMRRLINHYHGYK